MDARHLKALEIAARIKLAYENGTWLVPSQTTNNSYKVVFKPEGSSCTCDDWLLRRQDCKHIIAARLVAERDGGSKAPPINIEEIPPKKKTFKQDWRAYNEAQINEKRRFQVLLVTAGEKT